MIAIVPLIKKELIVMLVSIIISLFLILASLFYLDEVEANKAESLQSLKQAKNKYRRAAEQKKVLDETKDAYKNIVNSGLTTKEDRISWLSNIDIIVDKYQMPMAKYSISKQIKLKGAALSVSYPAIDIFQSEMNIEIDMLHELDLIKFINMLDKRSKGVFDISSCELKRLYIDFKEIIKNKKNKNISAHCKLSWLSLQAVGI